ncbi:MAG: hypothetical protein PVI80_11200 [Anaerolineae bacterium]|jgi:hypothetical protein
MIFGGWRRVGLVLVTILLVACGTGGELPAAALPEGGAVTGWAPSGEVQIYDTENLYSLVNGQADAYFAYAFERVAVRTYEGEDGASLRVEVWQLGEPADAYGLLTTVRGGEPVLIGNGGDGDPGRRLDFWQDRYFVRLFAVSPVDDIALQAFAEQVSGKLPTGGERPAMVARLPEEGLVEESDLFFHQEISIQDQLWLGGQNLLALGPETDGVLARYEIAGGEGWLLLVQYEDNGASSAALDALRAGGISDLFAAEADRNLLAAVFGPMTEVEAQALLSSALGTD